MTEPPNPLDVIGPTEREESQQMTEMLNPCAEFPNCPERQVCDFCQQEKPENTVTEQIDRIETWTKDEFKPGVSAGAAARQLCRMLGCANAAPTLKRLMEELLVEANKAAHDRHMILSAFQNVDPEAAQIAKRESFRRNNPERDAVR